VGQINVDQHLLVHDHINVTVIMVF